jgi:ABC-type tungstate transport system permease subunit
MACRRIDPAKTGGGSWYRDIGGGMGAALNAAQAMNAYTISDRRTWLSFGNKGDLIVAIAGDPRLLNRYDVILLNPAKHPEPKQRAARRFAEWLVSPEGQAAIGNRRVQSQRSAFISPLQRRLQGELSARAGWRSHWSPLRLNHPQAYAQADIAHRLRHGSRGSSNSKRIER